MSSVTSSVFNGTHTTSNLITIAGTVNGTTDITSRWVTSAGITGALFSLTSTANWLTGNGTLNGTHAYNGTFPNIPNQWLTPAALPSAGNQELQILSIQLLNKVCCNTSDIAFRTTVCDNLYRLAENPNLKNLEASSVSKVIQLTLYLVILLLSLFGNLMVFLTLIINKHMRSTTNVFILSLAASDVVLTCSTVPLSIIEVITTFWTLGSFACKFYPCIMNFCVASSSLTMCCIAIERYYAIVHPFKLKFFQTPSRAGFLLLVVWVISGIASFPQATCYHIVEIPFRCHSKYTCIFKHFHLKELVQIWLNFVVLFVIPFTIMLITYGIIIYRLWIKHPVGVSTKAADINRLRMKKRAIKMLITVVVLFVISWLPVQCFNIITEKSNSIISKEILSVRSYLKILALSSCCYNPIIYTFMNEKFRQNFANIVLCRKKKVYPIAAFKKNQRPSLEARESVKETRERLELEDCTRSMATAETRM